MSERDAGLTIIGRCGLRQLCLRLVSDRAKPGDWESLPRREPKAARERLGPIRSSKIRAKR